VLNRECEGVVYLLWGEYAQKKGRLVDESRHRVLRGPHPSPLVRTSQHPTLALWRHRHRHTRALTRWLVLQARGFEGCNHFVQCNELLRQLGKTPIDWSLSP
jgi:uracil-DNA glycosylase